MRGWLPALRIARREARKAKGRSSLVLAMIGLPVAFLAFAAVTFDMFQLTPREKLDRELGTGDAYIWWHDTDAITQSPDASNVTRVTPAKPSSDGALEKERPMPTEADVLALLPPGSRALAMEEDTVKVRTPDGIGQIQTRLDDVSEPMLQGMVELLAGRAAKAADEVVLNEAAAQWLGVGIGGTINALNPDRVYRVTGIVEYPDNLFPRMASPTGTGKGWYWLVASPTPVDWEQVKRLNKLGMVVKSRVVVLNPPLDAPTGFDPGAVMAEDMALGVVVGGLAVLEIILLAGPALAVGARRRSRDLALVAAAGGEPKQLRRIVLADGVVLGLAGAVIGLALGVVLALIGRPLIEDNLAHARAGGYRFFPLALVGIAGLAVITGMLAALVPAYTAARQPVVLALAGRRGILRSRKRWVFAGIVLAALGSAIAVIGSVSFDETLMLSGVVLAELGLVLVTPALIGLIARLGRWLPLAPRLALRDTARNRSSAAPAVSAVMAAVAGAVAAGVVFAAQHQQSVAEYKPRLPHGHIDIQHYSDPGEQELNWSEAEAMVRSVLPDAQIHRFMRGDGLTPARPLELECPLSRLERDPTAEEMQAARTDKRCRQSMSTFGLGVVTNDGSGLAAFTGADPDRIAKAREVLDRGGAIVTDERMVKDGRVTLEAPRGKQSITVDGYFLGDYPGFTAMLSPKIQDGEQRTAGLVVDTTAVPTQAQEERLNLLMRQLDAGVWVTIERGPQDRSNLMALLIAAAAAIIALGAAAIATGLAAADTRADLGTLAAVGA
uniref:ABC transporter permease n=1 Tax=Allorhizocola rhizosphaerae TaxID=1872709 RepID=UPI000E3D3FA0